MPSNPPLTDEEVCRKFGLPDAGHRSFASARAICDNRYDRAIHELPDMECIHCCHPFQATWHDVADGLEPDGTGEMPCEHCERIIYIEHVALYRGDVETTDEAGDADTVLVTVCTDPQPRPEDNP